jgi:hypothetical protein
MRVFLAVTLALCLVACGKPVPPEKASYVGLWRAPQMVLLITQDGSVKYERIEAGVTKSVSGPLKGFNGNNFEVGLGPFSTTFVVASPPHLDGEVTKMTVDGVELTKATQQPASTSVGRGSGGSNPSIEGTSTSKLRLLAAAPHVKR